MVIVFSIIIAGFTVYQTLFLKGEIERKIEIEVDSALSRSIDNLNKKVLAMKGVLRLMVNDGIIAKEVRSKNQAGILNRIEYYSPILDLMNVEIFDVDGNYYTTTRTDFKYRFTDVEMKQAINTVTQDSSVFFYTKKNALIVKYLQRDAGLSGSGFSGIIAAGFCFDNENLYADYLKEAIGSDFFIINEDKVISSTFIDENTLERFTAVKIPEYYLNEVKERGDSFIKEININGNKYVVALSKIALNRGNSTGIIGAAVDRFVIENIIRQNIITAVVISVLMFLFIVIVSILISNRITKPIRSLTEVANINAGGGFRIVENISKNEIGDFTVQFNNMINELRNVHNTLEERITERTKELKDSNEKLKIAYEEKIKDLKMAQRIQSALIPRNFEDIDSVEIKGLYIPMDDLGGDLYDVYRLSGNRIAIVILDVAGHGVPASLITTMAKISFSTNSQKSNNAGEVVKMVNSDVYHALGDNNDFFTAFYCIIDIEHNVMEYVNAGHNEIYLKKSDNSIVSLKVTGPMIGVMNDIEFETGRVNISNGDRLVLYTDGVVEAKDDTDKAYEPARLVDFIIHHHGNPEDFVKKLHKDLMDFKKLTPHNDDITLLVVDIK